MRTPRDKSPPRMVSKTVPPPPNYTSRKVQFRLLTMIFAFGATLWMMNEARKPENWRWFTKLDQTSEQQEFQTTILQTTGQEPDTRLRERPQADRDPPGVINLGTSAPERELELPVTAKSDGRRLAIYAAWQQALGGLDRQERRLFDALMLASRGRIELSSEKAELRKEMLGKLNQEWNVYLQNAFQAVIEQRESLSDDDKAAWLAIIQQMEAQWENGLHPALMAVSAGSDLTAEQQELLAQAQEVIDRVNVAAITDNAITRPQDEHAWFRMLEQLETADQQQLERQTVPVVGFLELFEQPDVYRGELVRISGDLKMVKRVRPPANAMEIQEYFMFWLRPDGGNSPIAIYTLELPPNFPEPDSQGTPLDSRATFTGYFFKRWVYPAGDGPRIAPVLLAKTPTWTAEPATRELKLPSVMLMGLLIGGAALLGVVVAVVVYLTARGKSSNRSPYNTSVQHAPERLAVLEQQPAPPTTGEKLEKYLSGDADQQGGEQP